MASRYITWRTGGFNLEDWKLVYDFIQSFKIQSVLEYGCGLSTELLQVIGMDLFTMETQRKWAEPYFKDPTFKLIICNYSDGYPELYRTYDMAFIDGPGEAEIHDRSKSVIHAKKYCSFIYMHDHDLNQYEHLDNDTNWTRLHPEMRTHNNFYKKIQ